MENKIPVPTDNIFKFYALFGLLLFVFSLGSVLYVTKTSNDVVYSSVPELAGLKHVEKPSEVDRAKMTLLERKLEVTEEDKRFFINASAVLGVLSVCMMVFGFGMWHLRVQPVLDETAQTNLEIAKLQLEKLRRELADKETS